MLSELLYADDLFLMSETIDGFRNKFRKFEAFKSKRLKANLEKTKAMVSVGMTRMTSLRAMFIHVRSLT